MRSLRTRFWARGRLTVAPGHREPQEAQTQILARRAPQPGRRARRGGVTRQSPTSLGVPPALSQVSKPFGKTPFTATLQPWPHLPRISHPTHGRSYADSPFREKRMG